jgi:hypothetical protein
MTVVAIHQPNFLPWLGYFYKLARADIFVFLDSVQYTKNSFINRSRIKTQAGAHWLTVPVWTSAKFGQTIDQVQTVPDTDWRRKHLHALKSHYGRAPHFREVFDVLHIQYSAIGARTSLADFNISMIRAISSYLGLEPKLIRARDLVAEGNSTELLVNICRELKADCYLAGAGAPKYQEDEQFASAGIRVDYSKFRIKPYEQLWGPFLGGLSVVDALMNCGRLTREL